MERLKLQRGVDPGRPWSLLQAEVAGQEPQGLDERILAGPPRLLWLAGPLCVLGGLGLAAASGWPAAPMAAGGFWGNGPSQQGEGVRITFSIGDSHSFEGREQMPCFSMGKAPEPPYGMSPGRQTARMPSLGSLAHHRGCCAREW